MLRSSQGSVDSDILFSLSGIQVISGEMRDEAIYS